jgi:hypothetical protein
VSLRWTASASDGGSTITGYNVYRGTTAGGESTTPVATGVSGTSFTDTSLVNSTTYFYTVVAVNAVGPSPASAETSATPRASVPTTPQAVVASGGVGSIVLSWAAPASDGGSKVTGYNVYRGTTAGGESVTPIATGVTATTFTDRAVTDGTTYYYKIVAVNAIGGSAPSTEVSAAPTPGSTASYVHRVASRTVGTASTQNALSAASPGVTAGDSLVAAVLLSGTGRYGAVHLTDSAGNMYRVVRIVYDARSASRMLTLVAFNAKPLSAGATMSLTHPRSASTSVSVDEFSGLTAVDRTSAAVATSTSFWTGKTLLTRQPAELLISVVANKGGSAPSWVSGWAPLPSLSTSVNHLGVAYRIVSSTGRYSANGRAGGRWSADIVTLRTG